MYLRNLRIFPTSLCERQEFSAGDKNRSRGGYLALILSFFHFFSDSLSFYLSNCLPVCLFSLYISFNPYFDLLLYFISLFLSLSYSPSLLVYLLSYLSISLCLHLHLSIILSFCFASFSSHAFLDRVQILQPNHVKRAVERGYLEQRGVLRTNCIDCLDRTNVGQFAVGTPLVNVLY